MEKLIVANWKANLGPNHVADWLEAFGRDCRPASSVLVVLAVPFLYLEQMAGKIADLEQVVLAAQSVSPFPPGSYTGATPAAWLKGLATYALIGHRERRRYFHEDIPSIAAQARESVAAGLRPVLCLDRGQKRDLLAALDTADLEQSLLAYTPGDAVQLEIAAASGDIMETAATLAEISGGRPVLYGGGVTLENAAELIHLDGISGVLVGRSCLDGGAFAALVNSIR